jgi:hypothetical protein
MDIFKHLKDNKDALIAEKKFKIKQADSVSYNVPLANIKGEAVKSGLTDSNADIETIKATVVINTTNILDSHGDVHIPGIWNKSLKELKRVYLLQEHQMKFDKIITDKVKASVKNISWSELGFPEFKGSTQALIFETEIDSDRNEYMFEQYLKGYVNNHSIGMSYVNLFLCINSEEKYYREEKDNWDKYIGEVVNQDKAIEQGYFWAVTEAKIVEGSAVPIGSNYATPTISVNTTQNIEADSVTSSKNNEPSNDTQPKQTINYNYILQTIKQKS